MASITAPDVVLELVDRFDHNSDAYRSGHYNETQVRLEFIDPKDFGGRAFYFRK